MSPVTHYYQLNTRTSRDAGASFEKILNPRDFAHGEYNPCLALFSNNDIYLVWESDTAHRYNVLFRKFEDYGQEPGPIIKLNKKSVKVIK